jgi:hypothetical protein
VRVVTGGAHDGNDLFHLRRIGRIAETLVARRSTAMESRHRRWRSTSTGAVELQLGHDPSPVRCTSRRIGRFRSEVTLDGAADAPLPLRE